MSSEKKSWGMAGDLSKAARTIKITMSDEMRFTPARIEVRQGETVRLLVRNAGRTLHEMVLGDRESLYEHAAMMARFPGMEHDEPDMVHVAPGKTGEIIWTFDRPGDFMFACLIPGHYEAGMVGHVKVAPSAGQGATR